jgi:hypothetical protein
LVLQVVNALQGSLDLVLDRRAVLFFVHKLAQVFTGSQHLDGTDLTFHIHNANVRTEYRALTLQLALVCFDLACSSFCLATLALISAWTALI